MIELLLVACRYGVVCRPARSVPSLPERVVFKRGCFAHHLDRRHRERREPVLLAAHRGERVFGRAVHAWDDVGQLMVTMRTSAPEIVAPVRSGAVFDGGCSVGWWTLDSDIITDDHGELEVIYDADVFEISLARPAALDGTGIIGWRPVAA